MTHVLVDEAIKSMTIEELAQHYADMNPESAIQDAFMKGAEMQKKRLDEGYEKFFRLTYQSQKETYDKHVRNQNHIGAHNTQQMMTTLELVMLSLNMVKPEFFRELRRKK